MAAPPPTCTIEKPDDPDGRSHVFVIGKDIEQYGEAGFAGVKSKAFTWKRLGPYGRSFLVTTREYACALRAVGSIWLLF